MYNLFGVLLDMGRYIPLLWKINIPTSLQETLWREINGSQPLDAPAWWEQRVSFDCACGARVSLDHILTGCGSYNLHPLQEVLWEKLWLISPPFSICTLHLDEWHPSPWYPILAMGRLEKGSVRPTKHWLKPNQALASSRPLREWAIGSFLWFVWKLWMKELYTEPKFTFWPHQHVSQLRAVLKPPALG